MSLKLATCVVAAAVLLGACLPGDRAKDLVVASECAQAIWLRVSEDAGATVTTFQGQPAIQLGADAKFQAKIFDNDADGFSIALAVSKNDVVKIIALPHSTENSIRVVINGDRCP